MENPCKIIFFGDSITKTYTPKIEKELRTAYPEISLTIINSGISGETTRDGLFRIQQALDEKPDVVVIGFGMNDWRKGVSKKEYKKNLLQMLDAFEKIGTRVIINTVSPSYNFQKQEYNKQVDDYSETVREIAYEKRIKIADINALWKRELRSPRKGLRDDIHPNSIGYDIICKCLMWIIPRKNTTLLWQYNGREAKCNYRCPYCYYVGLHNPRDMSFGTIEEWYSGLKNCFRNQDLVIYLGFGEPTLGKMFPEIVRMFEEKSNWELRIISNLDTNQAEMVASSRLAIEKRLHIVGSFHPCRTTRDKYIDKLKFFREKGIEVPTVYVGWPPYLKHFEDDIEFFRKHGFLVHVRRMQGIYKKRLYPYAYTEAERKMLARYMDDGMLKYMHAGLSQKNKLTFSGFHFFVMDNVGNIGYDSNLFMPYTRYRCIFGNLFQENFRPLLLPGQYPGSFEGTDDGIANVIDYQYKELEGNHVTSFARQGGVYKNKSGAVIYSNEHKDFNDPKTRAEYNFPPRDLKDYMAIIKYSKTPQLLQSAYKVIYPIGKKLANQSPALKKIGEKIIKR
jgi:lysophospholipase L1-like esterase